MVADAFFLPAILALGIVSTLQDFRVRRISKWWIVISLIYAIIAHIILFFCGNSQETWWFSRAFVNVLISALVAIYFWRQNWWGGGDAKLFICYSALIPLSHYPFGYFSYYFASFLLLVITFVPAAIWTFLHAQFNLMKVGRNIFDNFKPNQVRLLEFTKFGIGFIAIFFLSNLLTLFLKNNVPSIKDFPIVIWLISIGFYRMIFKMFQNRWWLVLAVWILGACIIIFVPFFKQVNIRHILIVSFFSWIVVLILRLFIFRTIEVYVESTKNNDMAFAGWMFFGALLIWFSRLIILRL